MTLIYSTELNNETFYSLPSMSSLCPFLLRLSCHLLEPEMCGARAADLEGLERSILSKPGTLPTLINQNQRRKGGARPLLSELMG